MASSWAVTDEGGELVVQFGELYLPLAGYPLRPEDLFAEIDEWVAFERPGGSGRVLGRDRQAVLQHRAALPGQLASWTGVAERVFTDIEATAAVLPWHLAVHEYEDAWPDPGVPGLHLWSHFAVPPVERPRVLFPRVWLHLPHTWHELPPFPDDPEDAVGDLAAMVQDDVIEEVHGAWPRCPGHHHPMALGMSAGTGIWRCPIDAGVVVRIGSLAELYR